MALGGLTLPRNHEHPLWLYGHNGWTDIPPKRAGEKQFDVNRVLDIPIWKAYSGVLRWNRLPQTRCLMEDVHIGQLVVPCFVQHEIAAVFLHTHYPHIFNKEGKPLPNMEPQGRGFVIADEDTGEQFYASAFGVGPLYGRNVFEQEMAKIQPEGEEWKRNNGILPWCNQHYLHPEVRDSNPIEPMLNFPYESGVRKTTPILLDIDHDRLGSSVKNARKYKYFDELYALKCDDDRAMVGRNGTAPTGIPPHAIEAPDPSKNSDWEPWKSDEEASDPCKWGGNVEFLDPKEWDVSRKPKPTEDAEDIAKLQEDLKTVQIKTADFVEKTNDFLTVVAELVNTGAKLANNYDIQPAPKPVTTTTISSETPTAVKEQPSPAQEVPKKRHFNLGGIGSSSKKTKPSAP